MINLGYRYSPGQGCATLLMFEVDYPHSGSTWPDTRDLAVELLGNLPADVVHKIVRGNAINLFGLDLPEPP